MELQEDCAVEVEDIWGEFHFAWDGATHCFCSNDIVEAAAPARSETNAKGGCSLEKAKYRRDGELGAVRDPGELKQQILRVRTERSHNGEIVRAIMMWKEWKPTNPVGKDRMQKGEYVEAWTEDIRLTLNQDMIAGDES